MLPETKSAIKYYTVSTVMIVFTIIVVLFTLALLFGE
jgi:hypothetical protein